MDKDKALKLALEVLKSERDKYLDWGDEDGAPEDVYEAITAIKQALSQPAPVPEGMKLVPVEPTQEMVKAFQDAMALEFGMRTTAGYHARVYSAMLAAAPAAQRQWVGLAHEEIAEIVTPYWDKYCDFDFQQFTQDIEAKLKEKNHDPM
jgi:hypothetical protein